MKTWEMIKELTEHPEKEFRNQDGNIIGIIHGILVWIEGNNHVTLFISSDMLDNCKWEEVKEPVAFMEAVKSGKQIKVKHELADGLVGRISKSYNYLDDVLNELGYQFDDTNVREIILNGEWYVED